MDKGFYLYAIGRCDASLSDVSGIDSIDSRYPVETLVNDDFTAIISKVPLEEFGEDALKKSIANMQWLERVARAHDAIVRHISSLSTIVPVRFGTVFLTAKNIEDFLVNNQQQLRSLLDSLNNLWEMGITLEFDEQKIAETLYDCSKEIRDLEAKINAAGTGAAYLLKKKLETMQTDYVTMLIEEQTDAFTAVIATLVTRIKKGELKRLPEKGLRCYVNLACLVPKDTVDSFKQQVSSIADSSNLKGITVRITGPWPPYSFSRLEGQTKDDREVNYAN